MITWAVLIDYLKANDLYDNTLIIFMADNGAAAEDFYNDEPFKDYVREHYDNAYGNMGRASSFVSYGPQWAEAGSAPFQRHKGYTREGGITAPMIISGPGGSRPRAEDFSLSDSDGPGADFPGTCRGGIPGGWLRAINAG